MAKWSGNTWLGWAFLLFCLSLISTVVVLFSGSPFDPTDRSSDHYAAGVPQAVVAMVVGILIPVLAAAASVLSIVARPQEGWRTTMASLLLLLSLASVWFCWIEGLDGVERLAGFAEHSPM